METPTKVKGLPENAFRELKPGESYIPIITDDSKVTEVSARSILIGFLMAIIFSAAVAFISLKTGNGIEAAVPIAIVAVGISAALRRKSTLLENVNILAIGATSSGVVGGMVFVIPALWILDLQHKTSIFQLFLIALLGALLGMLFLIPFRRYFVDEMHGKLPFPEGTAITEILVAGEKGGASAKVLLYALGVGFVYDLLIMKFSIWHEIVSTTSVRFFDTFTSKIKMVCNLDALASLGGLGMIIGLRYASIILAGSMLGWWVLVPLFNWFGGFIDVPISNSGQILAEGALLRDMVADDIFYDYVRFIGIGGIFTAGFISIAKLWKVIGQAMTTGLKGIFSSLGGQSTTVSERRTDSDIAMPKVMAMLLAVGLAIFLYYRFSVLIGQPQATMNSFLSLLIVFVISFLFTAVSAWAIAMISVTPVSGMTLTTLIITGVVMFKLGLTGEAGMISAILIGTVVCTALAMAGTLITEFKIAYWVGATPKKVQWWNIIGAFVAAIAAGLVIYLLAESFGFVKSAENPNPLVAPQANAMAAVIKGLLSTGEAPWLLYGLGAVIALTIEFVGVSSLAFALGMYLPIELNTPIFLGALLMWGLKKTAKSKEEAHARGEKGNLVASGLIAGGGLAGVFAAFLLLGEKQLGFKTPSFGADGIFGAGSWLGFVFFMLLLGWIWWDVKRAKVEE